MQSGKPTTASACFRLRQGYDLRDRSAVLRVSHLGSESGGPRSSDVCAVRLLLVEELAQILQRFLNQAAQEFTGSGELKRQPYGLHLPVGARCPALEAGHHAIGAAHFTRCGWSTQHLGVGCEALNCEYKVGALTRNRGDGVDPIRPEADGEFRRGRCCIKRHVGRELGAHHGTIALCPVQA